MQSKFLITAIVIIVGILSTSCKTYRTHLYGMVYDEQDKPVLGVKLSAIRIQKKRDSTVVDTLASVYNNVESGYQLNFTSKKKYKNVQLVNPYSMNPQLPEKYKSVEVYKGGRTLVNCCDVVVGQPNQYGFRLIK